MNSLKREIQKDEIVVIKASVMKPEFRDLSERLFVCKSGFGLSNKTAGSGIWGAYLKDAEETRHEGYEIDPDETAEYQRTHVSNLNLIQNQRRSKTNTVKLMKIVDIHPEDAHYKNKGKYVGTTRFLVVESREYAPGWQATKSGTWGANGLKDLPKGIRPEQLEFWAVKLQRPNLIDRLMCVRKYGWYAMKA